MANARISTFHRPDFGAVIAAVDRASVVEGRMPSTAGTSIRRFTREEPMETPMSIIVVDETTPVAHNDARLNGQEQETREPEKERLTRVRRRPLRPLSDRCVTRTAEFR